MRYILFISTVILLWSCGKSDTEDISDNVFYTCSMDPQVMEKKPGKCPICKMDLTKVIVDKQAMQSGLKISKEQEQLANIKTIIISETEINREKVVSGTLVLNENQRYRISTRVSGRVEKLYIKNTGEQIKKGTLLYTLYSEELLAAQKEYLIALERIQQVSDSGLDYAQLLDGAKNKLLLWGMNDNQIKALASSHEFRNAVSIYSREEGVATAVNVKEGDYILDGDIVFEVANLSTLWVEAQIYATEVNEFKSNTPVIVKIDGFPGKSWNSTIVFYSPELQAQSKVNTIRAEISNSDKALMPGMQANVLLKGSVKQSVSIPLQAVLQDSQGATVWIKKKDGSYESKMVITGIQNDNDIEIRSGLELGEEVVVSGAYLLNSEYIFKKGATPMAGHDMSTH